MKMSKDEINKIKKFFESKSGLYGVWAIEPTIFKMQYSEENKKIEVIIARNEATNEIKLFDKYEILNMGEE